MSIGKRIKQRRTELGLTQEELAKRLGNKSRASVCTVERDKEDLTATRIKQYAAALECSPGYLMGWEEYTPPAGTPTFTVSRENLKGMILSDEERDLIILLRNTTEEKRRLLMQLLEYLLSIKEE